MELCLYKNKHNISLFDALKEAKESSTEIAYLQDIINFNQQNPYKIYQLFFYILEIKAGKKAIISRFGLETEEIISQFLILCLDYEQNNIADLENFIDSFNNSNLEIKIDANNQIFDETEIFNRKESITKGCYRIL